MLVAKQPLYQPQPPLRQPSTRPKKQVKTSSFSDTDKRLVILAILLTAVMSFAMIWRFASVNDLQARVSKLERGITNLEDENAALIIQLKQLSSPRRIEDRANEELGMRWPDQEQIINVFTTGPEN